MREVSKIMQVPRGKCDFNILKLKPDMTLVSFPVLNNFSIAVKMQKETISFSDVHDRRHVKNLEKFLFE